MSEANKWSEQVLTVLHRKGRLRRGSISNAEKAIGVAQGYLRNRRLAGSIEISKLMGLLEAMQLHPSRFFRQAFPENESLWSLIDPPQGRKPAILTKAKKRLASEAEVTIPRDHLLQLDSLKYANPEKAAQATENAIDFVSADDVPLLLGIWASAQRLLIELDKATHAIWFACTVANDRGQQTIYADLLQRLAFVVADQGSYDISLTLSKQATDVFLCAGDLAGVGRTLVDRSLWSYHLEYPNESTTLTKQALALLPSDDFRNRCAAFHILGVCARDADDLAQAEHYMAKALSLGAHLEPLNIGKLRWFGALIKADHDKQAEAISILSEVVDLFRPIHRGETALVAVDLVRLLVKNSRHSEALAVVQSIVPLLSRHAGRNPIVAAAEATLVDLIRSGASKLSLRHVTALQRAVQRIQQERHLWRSLKG